MSDELFCGICDKPISQGDHSPCVVIHRFLTYVNDIKAGKMTICFLEVPPNAKALVVKTNRSREKAWRLNMRRDIEEIFGHLNLPVLIHDADMDIIASPSVEAKARGD